MAGLKKLVSQFETLVTENPVKLHEEWFRLQTFSSWPFEAPRPAELAKAGLYYAPVTSEGQTDRCECSFCGKVFMEWEPADDPLEAHRMNVPDCPFILGKSNNIPMPSAYGVVAGKPAPAKPAANLGSWMEKLQEGMPAIASGSKPKEPPRARAQFPEPPSLPVHPARANQDSHHVPQVAPLSSSETVKPVTADEEADQLVVRLHSSKAGKKGKKKSSNVIVLETEQKRREEMLAQQRTEWTAIQLLIETSTKVLHEIWERQLSTADEKLNGMSKRMDSISAKATQINTGAWMKGKRESLQKLEDELEEVRSKVKAEEAALVLLGTRSAAEKRDLKRLANKEELLREYDEQSSAKLAGLEELEAKMTALKEDIQRLVAEKDEVLEAEKAGKVAMAEAIEELKGEKLQVQADLVDTRDLLERRRSELEVYEIKLQDWSRREEIANNLEAELKEKEDAVGKRERAVRSREEVLDRKEVELLEAIEATRKARKEGKATAPSGDSVDGVWEPASDDEDSDDDVLSSKRDELLGLMHR